MSNRTYDVRTRIEDKADLYVGERAREAMQVDAMEQLACDLNDLTRLCGDINAADFDALDEIANVAWHAASCADALVNLCPLPEEVSDGQ